MGEALLESVMSTLNESAGPRPRVRVGGRTSASTARTAALKAVSHVSADTGATLRITESQRSDQGAPCAAQDGSRQRVMASARSSASGLRELATSAA